SKNGRTIVEAARLLVSAQASSRTSVDLGSPACIPKNCVRPYFSPVDHSSSASRNCVRPYFSLLGGDVAATDDLRVFRDLRLDERGELGRRATHRIEPFARHELAHAGGLE